MNQILATTLFLGVVGILVPLLAYASRKVFENPDIEIDRHPFYAEAILVQLVLLLLAAWAARANGVELAILAEFDVRSIVTALIVFSVALATFVLSWRYASDSRKERLLRIIPMTRSERFVWALVSLSAGVSEELIYRGVLFGLVYVNTGNWIVAAAVSTVAFALAHLAQGTLSAVAVGIFGLVLQILVAQTGALLLVIVIHFLYDLIAGLTISLSRKPEGAER